jgi:hypothetical protein
MRTSIVILFAVATCTSVSFACSLSDIEVTRPQLLELQRRGVLTTGIEEDTLQKFPVLRITFRHARLSKMIQVPTESGGASEHKVNYVSLIEDTDFDGAGVVQAYEEQVKDLLGANSCEERYFPFGFRITADSSGKGVGNFSTRYEKWVCGGFHYIRCRHLKCKKAYKRVRTKLFQKTLDFRTEFSVRVNDGLVNVEYENKRTTNLNDLEKFFGRLFLGRRDFDRMMDNMNVSGWAAQLRLSTGLETDGIPKDAVPRVVQRGTGFLHVDGQTFMRLHATAPSPMEESEYCFGGLPEVQRIAALLRSSSPDHPVAHVVAPNENLWRIASRYYGDGRYMEAILEANPSLRARANKLDPGQSLVLPRMYEVVSNPNLVRSGESVSRVAERALGSVSRASDIISSDDRVSANPDLVFPIQALKAARQ